MSTLNNIKKMANEIYPGCSHGLSHLLCAWARSNSGDLLETILHDGGLSVSGLLDAFEPFLTADPIPEEQELLERCIMDNSWGQLTGYHLLGVVCSTPTSRLFHALSLRGADMKKLSHALEKKAKEIVFPSSGNKPKDDISDPVPDSLSMYGRDLSSLALSGKFRELADRDEIDQIIGVLLKKQKANIALTGPAGVGKSCLVELLSCKLAHNKIDCLSKVRIFELHIGRVVASSKYRGEFEKKMYTILDAAQNHGGLILFIDEMHLLMGAGAAEGVTTDAANILKPYLSRDSLRVIGATTHEEYQKYIKTDAAIDRRFQEIKVEKPDAVLTRHIVRKQANILEEYHCVSISDDLVSSAIDLSNRYIVDRNQPDKSVDLLDTSAAEAKRNGKQILSLQELFCVLSNRVGRQIRPPQDIPANLWINDLWSSHAVRRCDIIVLKAPAMEHSRELIKTRLKEMRSCLLEKQIELIIEDEDRLLDYLLLELNRDSRRATHIDRLIERKILRPIAVNFIEKDYKSEMSRIVLGDVFYATGKVLLV